VIATVTPNPSIDRTVGVDHLERGGLNRALDATVEAAGKGLNVSRALHRAGVATLAILPLAKESAAAFVALLGRSVPISTVPLRGSVRVNISIVESDGTVTKVNEPGPQITNTDATALIRAAADADPVWIVGCGSLPPGAPLTFYASLTELRADGRRVAIDTSGEPLRAAVAAHPDLVKPNLPELEELCGRSLATFGAVVAAAEALVADGIGSVLVSLGRQGALHVDREGAIHAQARIDGVVNSVGAGDALLAGYLAAGGGPKAVAHAVAWATAAVRSPGTQMQNVTADDLEAVSVSRRIDLAREVAA
jgi:1-phosphofructokinase